MSKKILYSILLHLVVVSFISCKGGDENTEESNAPEVIADGASWGKGIALYSFHRHPFATALEMSDSAEAEYVEGFSFYKMGGAFGESTMGNLNKEGIGLLKKMLDEKKISMSSMYVDGAKNEEDWKNFFELGRALGLKYFVSEPKKEHWDIIDRLAGEYNIPVAIHEHARGLSAYWHPDSVLAAISGRKNIGACADLGHWVRSGLDPVKCLQQLEGHIIGVHFKDIDKADLTGKDVTPGTGAIDFPAVVKELKRQGFKGIMHVECEYNLNDNLDDVRQTLKYIDQLTSDVFSVSE